MKQITYALRFGKGVALAVSGTVDADLSCKEIVIGNAIRLPFRWVAGSKNGVCIWYDGDEKSLINKTVEFVS